MLPVIHLDRDMKGSEYNTVFKGLKARVYHFLARDDLSVISHHPSRLGANFDGFDKFQFNATPKVWSSFNNMDTAFINVLAQVS